MTKLFTLKQVKKFFNILDRLSGSIPIDKSNYPWKDYQTVYTKKSEHCPSTREVFVHRTINKWLKGKYLIIYRVSDLGVTYKQYVSLSNMSYNNDWGSGYINVGLIDYIKPYESLVFGGEKVKHNDALSLEGEWYNDGTMHHKLLELSSMANVLDKEYIFKAYDWSKYPKRKKKGIDPKNLMKTTKSFIAKTEHQAYKSKKEFEEQCKETKGQLMVTELIDVKLIKNGNSN